MKVQLAWQVRSAGAELRPNFTMGEVLHSFVIGKGGGIARAANRKRFLGRVSGGKIKNRSADSI